MDRAARNTKGGREMNVDTGCKVRKVTWTLPPLLTREQSPTDAASTPFCLRHFFSCGICARERSGREKEEDNARMERWRKKGARDWNG